MNSHDTCGVRIHLQQARHHAHALVYALLLTRTYFGDTRARPGRASAWS
jgi:hypothetical protein